MKYTFFLFTLCLVCFFFNGFSQQGDIPVQWKFTANKVGDNTFEVHALATIKDGWHIYGLSSPDGLPTSFQFNKHSFVELSGPVKDSGGLDGVSAMHYLSSVDFVQLVKLKQNASTEISGEVSYQACNDVLCLLPTTQAFVVALDNSVPDSKP